MKTTKNPNNIAAVNPQLENNTLDKNEHSQEDENYLEIEIFGIHKTNQASPNKIITERRRSERSNSGVLPNRYACAVKSTTIIEPKDWKDLTTLKKNKLGSKPHKTK